MAADKSEALVTAETVERAVKTLMDLKQRVSVSSVKGILGGGSPNTVLQHLRTIRAAKMPPSDIPATDQEKVSPAPPTEALPEVTAAVAAMVQAVTEAVSRVRIADRASSDERLAGLQRGHAADLANCDRVHAQEKTRLETLLREADAELEAAMPILEEADALRGRLAEAEGLLTAAKSAAAEMKVALEAALSAVQVAETATARADADAEGWRRELTVVRNELQASGVTATTARHELAKVQAEQASAVADGRAAAARADSAEREAERARAAAERERTAREASEARMADLMHRAATAEAKLAAAVPEEGVVVNTPPGKGRMRPAA